MANPKVAPNDGWVDAKPAITQPAQPDGWVDAPAKGLSPADVQGLTTHGPGFSESRATHRNPPGFWDSLSKDIGPQAWMNTYRALKANPLKTIGSALGQAGTMGVGGFDPLPGGGVSMPGAGVQTAQKAFTEGPGAVGAQAATGAISAATSALPMAAPQIAQAAGDVAPAVGAVTKGAVEGALGTSPMEIGGGMMAGNYLGRTVAKIPGMEGAETVAGGVAPIVRNAIRGGIRGYRSLKPEVQAAKRVAPPALQGSSLERMAEPPGTPPPPIQGSSLERMTPPEAPSTPPPALQGSSAARASVPPTPRRVAPPPIQGSSLARTAEDEPSAPPSAATPTVPETPSTVSTQLSQLAGGQRKVVMLPKGTPPQSPPPGMRIYQDASGNSFVYDPKSITTGEIRAASSGNQLPQILGPTKGGLGAPDKSALTGPPMAVVGKSPSGTEVQATATDQPNLATTAAQTAKVTPPGGKVEVTNPASVLEARVEGPSQTAELSDRPNWQSQPTGAKVAIAQPGDPRFSPPDHLVWQGSGPAPYEGRPLVVEQVNRKTGAVTAGVPGRADLGPVKLSAKDLGNWEVRQTPIFANEARALAANQGISLSAAKAQLLSQYNRPVSDHPLGRLPGEGSYLKTNGYKLNQPKPKAPQPPGPPTAEAGSPPPGPSSLPSSIPAAEVEDYARMRGIPVTQAISQLTQAGVRVELG